MKRVLAVVCILVYCNSALAMSYKEHELLWKTMENFSLSSGGLGGEFPFDNRLEIHNYMDKQGSYKTGMTGQYKRHGLSHNPVHVSEWALSKGMHQIAAFNAASIHIIADMCGDSDHNKAGVNGHARTKKNMAACSQVLEKIKKR